MINLETFYFWVFILGSMLIVYVAYILGRAERQVSHVELIEMFNEMEVEDIEEC